MSRDKQIQLRRDVSSDWSSINPILASGEPGLETDTGKLKVGNGVTAWNDLAYFTQGVKGDKGDRGFQGTAGLKGATGNDGADGAPGATGLPGAKGNTGAKGDKGDTGAPGTNGSNGAKGEKGDKGDTGNTGATGSPGLTGSQGAQGIKGDKGDKGDTGDPGVNGTDGTDGVIQSIVAGSGITVDDTDPANPEISTSGAVTSVNGDTGDVVLDQDDVLDGTTNKQYSATEKTKLAGVEASADVTDATNVAAAGAFMKSVDDTDDIAVGATNKFTTAAEKIKLGYIAVTQAVDLDAMESKLAGIESGADVTDNANVLAALGFTPENAANKATNFSIVNDTLYPTVEAVQEAIIAAVAGLLDYRGSFDASSNLFPATGGSGLVGAILSGDFWICSVPGTLGGTAVTAGDLIIAKTDTPGQTAGNWDIVSNEIGYVPEDVANKDADSTFAANSDAKYPSQKAVKTAIDGKQPLDSDLTTIAGLTPTTDNFMVGTASAWASRTPTQARSQMGLGALATLATVGTAQIDNNAVTPAKISTMLIPLGFDEDNGAGAVLTTSYVTKSTITATTLGGVVAIIANASVRDGNSGANRKVYVRITCDGVLVGTEREIDSLANGLNSQSVIHLKHTPSAGSHTWNIEVKGGTGSATLMYESSIQVMEIK